MPNEKLVSIRGEENLLKSESYRLYHQLKQEILKDYPPPKLRTREQSLEVSRRVCELMHEVNGPFQTFVWEQKSEQNRVQEERWAQNRKPGGKRGPKVKDEEDYI